MAKENPVYRQVPQNLDPEVRDVLIRLTLLASLTKRLPRPGRQLVLDRILSRQRPTSGWSLNDVESILDSLTSAIGAAYGWSTNVHETAQDSNSLDRQSGAKAPSLSQDGKVAQPLRSDVSDTDKDFVQDSGHR